MNFKSIVVTFSPSEREKWTFWGDPVWERERSGCLRLGLRKEVPRESREKIFLSIEEKSLGGPRRSL
jgi:hypothetical protein